MAAVNGVAAGAGFSLALACDLRVMAETATFISAFGRIGLVPDSGLSWFLPRLVGPARAAEIVMTTDAVDAATAERIGLVNRVVPAEACLAEAQALAARLAAGAPLALGLAKRSLAYALEHDLSVEPGLRGRAPGHRRPLGRPRRGDRRLHREAPAAVHGRVSDGRAVRP